MITQQRYCFLNNYNEKFRNFLKNGQKFVMSMM